MNCPGCHSPTEEKDFEGVAGARILLDVCHHCHGLWFDKTESPRLAPAGALSLFRALHEPEPRARPKPPESMQCPRCASALARIYDFARNNRFHSFRCPEGHGHFIPFFQFLRAKGIVRTLLPRELSELRQRVPTVQCSDCAAPVELATRSECAQCQTPVSVLDPSGVEAVFQKQALDKRHALAAASVPLGVDAALSRQPAGTAGDGGVIVDLVEVGLEVLFEGLLNF